MNELIITHCINPRRETYIQVFILLAKWKGPLQYLRHYRGFLKCLKEHFKFGRFLTPPMIFAKSKP